MTWLVTIKERGSCVLKEDPVFLMEGNGLLDETKYKNNTKPDYFIKKTYKIHDTRAWTPNKVFYWQLG